MLQKADGADQQRELCGQVVDELRRHTRLEEEVFYPFLRDATGRDDLFEEAMLEHGFAKELLDQLPNESPGTARMTAMVKVLSDQIQHHVQEEESQIFPQVEKSGVDLEALGEELMLRRDGAPRAAGGKGDGTAETEREAKGAQAASRQGSDPAARRNGGRQDGVDARQLARDDEQFLADNEGGLSRSTQRARWIHSPADKPDRDGQTLATRNPEVIRAWAEARGGKPATSHGGDPDNPRVLRFDFDGQEATLHPVSWEAWLRVFEERRLVFLYQETLAKGNQSNFFRLDSLEREDG